MRPRMMAILLPVAWVVSALGLTRAGDNSPIDFDTQVIPVLTKSGCNSGACHGAAAGRGEFRLSLYGSRPAADFAAITLALGGRRINHNSPENSLLLRKPTEMIYHGGGQRLKFDQPGYTILLKWIGAGANRARSRRLVGFRFSREQIETMEIGSCCQLVAVASFDDGSTENVLPTTVITSSDDDAISVDAMGRATVHRAGRHLLLARYLNRVVPLEILVPVGSSPPGDQSRKQLKTIDDFVDDRLAQLGLPTADRSPDHFLNRRLYLDLAGRLPDIEAQRPGQQQKDFSAETLVDHLLDSQAFTDFWTYRLALLFRVAAARPESPQAHAWYEWLRESVARDASIADMAREMLLAVGPVADSPAGGFFAVAEDPRLQAEYASSVLLGVRLQCANCHDHPLDAWTQDDYHGLAAIFATVRGGRVVENVAGGHVIHPVTGEPAQARIPGDRMLKDQAAYRKDLAAWLVADENPWFARAIVNRVWKHLMGRGLVEPIDDLRSTNPPTHPGLMQVLTESFVDSGYRLRPLIRQICTSNAYLRASRDSGMPQQFAEFYGSAYRKPLSPAVYLAAVAAVTGVPAYADNPLASPLSLRGLSSSDSPLRGLGSCGPTDLCENPQLKKTDVTFQLGLLTGDVLNARLTPAARSFLQNSGSDEASLARVYQHALNRTPTQSESRFWNEEFSRATSPLDRQELMEDLLWAVLTSREFTHNN